MKKILAFLGGALILASCSTEMSLAKRHYRSGYYFATSTKNNQLIARKEKKAEISSEPKTAVAAGQVDVVPETSKALIAQPEIRTSKSAEKKSEKHLLKQAQPGAAPAMGVMPGTLKTNIPFIQAVSLKKAGKRAVKGDSDANLIVMIILCLFPLINLIPVYLHDSKAITLNFWITLLLDFTWIGGAIFAILVVLDIVNLA